MNMTMTGRVFSCIDNTTLNATDNEQSVRAFCRRTREMVINGDTTVAAVCVYPSLVKIAVVELKGSGIRVASVAGAFPHGQLPLKLKCNEVIEAIGDGADEIDVVINRGLLLAGNYDAVRNEVAEMKKACGGKTLKVILETGELPSPALVRKASELAIEGGADFIKTSTGKIGVGATLEAAEVMLQTIADYVKICKKTIGFKAAGGIRKPEEATAYAEKAKKIIGDGYINNQTFRIGASSLTESMFSLLTF